MPDTTSPLPAAPPGKHYIKVQQAVNGFEKTVDVLVDDNTSAPTWGDRTQMTYVNKSVPRVDGPMKVTGTAKYTHDIRLPNMLFGRILQAPYASAKVTSIDTSAAEKIPGVIAVISNGNKTIRFQGDPLAAVAAETPEAAEDGIRAIKVTYQPGNHVVDPDDAVQPDAPKVYPDGNIRPGGTRGDQADVAAQLAQCAAVVEGEFRTPFQHHSCLETHGIVVDYTGGDSATVYASTQSTFSIPGDAANVLGLDSSKVVAITEYMGGGFGNKYGIGMPGDYACQLSKQTKRPVHLMLTRSDEFLTAGNRSASIVRLKIGAGADGKLVAISAEQHRLGGLGEGSQQDQPWRYHVPHVYRTVDSIHMNIDSSSAFRAPGAPQTAFPMESIMDDLAAKLELDPIELRKRNVDDQTYHRQMDLGAARIGWAAGRNSRPGVGQTNAKKRGMGLALSAWGGGGGPACKVTVNISPNGAVDILSGTQDLGTGTRTYMASIVADELALPITAVTAHIGDSRNGSANGSGGSTTAASLAPAVKDAAHNARTALLGRIAQAVDAKPEDMAMSGGKVVVSPTKTITFKQACALLGTTGVSVTGEWKPGLSDGGTHGVQIAEVEVDTETGRVKVLRLVGVQDCGLPLNRLTLESQLNGGMIQGMGYALYEQKVTDRTTGLMLNTNFEEYKLPGTMEMPEFIPIIDDADKRGVIGAAEPVTVPTAAAIANAVYNACGVRIRTLPITPDKVLNGLAALRGGAKA
jgi:xanthine dehydrogenase YagR molybdenum-binding subunit